MICYNYYDCSVKLRAFSIQLYYINILVSPTASITPQRMSFHWLYQSDNNAWMTVTYTGILFLDMSKSFDRVKHQPLMNELHSCRICGTAQSWFASYLSARRHTFCSHISFSSVSAAEFPIPGLLGLHSLPCHWTCSVRLVCELK